MADRIAARLKDRGIVIPDAPSPVANYVPSVLAGNLLFVSGQGTRWDGEWRYLGKVGQDLTLDEGNKAARICGLNILAQVNAACDGDLDRVRRVVKLGGWVNCGPGFADHPKVINGASDLMVEIFDDAGRHSRFAIGAPSLPGNIAVEVEGVFELA